MVLNYKKFQVTGRWLHFLFPQNGSSQNRQNQLLVNSITQLLKPPKGHLVSDKWNLCSSWEKLQNLWYGLQTLRRFKKPETASGSLLRMLCFTDTYKPDQGNQTNSVRLHQTHFSQASFFAIQLTFYYTASNGFSSMQAPGITSLQTFQPRF